MPVEIQLTSLSSHGMIYLVAKLSWGYSLGGKQVAGSDQSAVRFRLAPPYFKSKRQRCRFFVLQYSRHIECCVLLVTKSYNSAAFIFYI